MYQPILEALVTTSILQILSFGRCRYGSMVGALFFTLQVVTNEETLMSIIISYSFSHFQAVAGCLLLAGYLFVHRRYSVDPEAVYRLALLKLNTHPGVLDVSPVHNCNSFDWYCMQGMLLTKYWATAFLIRRLIDFCFPLQVMGAPLAGSEMRAYVLTGGGLRMQVCVESAMMMLCIVEYSLIIKMWCTARVRRDFHNSW